MLFKKNKIQDKVEDSTTPNGKCAEACGAVHGKTKVYNLIILDKSGSMSSIAKAAISGFNETVGGIRSAQELYREQVDYTGRVAPDRIDSLRPNEIFVFGSNLAGAHGGGAAYAAVQKFGAVMGQGVGLQGQCYAIPTMQGGVETIQPYVDEFIQFAKDHPQLTFLVTRIGCGIAGFTDQEIAPLFVKAVDVPNIHLPQSFWNVLV